MRRELLSLAAVACLAACGRDSTPRPDSSSAIVRPESSSAAVRVDSTATKPPAASRDSSAPSPAPGGGVQVSEHGVGPLKIGMTLAQARTATNGTLSAPPAADTAECGFATWRAGPAGLRFLTAKGRIVRVDVTRGDVPTAAGAHIGDSEAQITALYPGRVETTPAKYTKGHYLTIKPATAADSAYRIIFETDGGRVKLFRAGKLPQVGYVEGCG
jgi:hypothetical protein